MYIDDGEIFKPERYLESDAPMKKWLPFGLGAHHCIGNKFALAETKVLLYFLLKNFQFRPVPDLVIKRKLALVLRPTPDVTLMVSKR